MSKLGSEWTDVDYRRSGDLSSAVRSLGYMKLSTQDSRKCKPSSWTDTRAFKGRRMEMKRSEDLRKMRITTV